MPDPFIGQIQPFAGSFAPQGWAMCWGQEIAISENPSLYSLIGTAYGGNGRTTFGLPDLRGRVVVGAGAGPGLTPRDRGQTGGHETVALTQAQMPGHIHEQNCQAGFAASASIDKGSTTVPQNGVLLASSYNVAFDANINWYIPSGSQVVELSGVEADTPTVTLATTGGGQGHENRQPFLAINFVIALVGIFPSRS